MQTDKVSSRVLFCLFCIEVAAILALGILGILMKIRVFYRIQGLGKVSDENSVAHDFITTEDLYAIPGLNICKSLYSLTAGTYMQW